MESRALRPHAQPSWLLPWNAMGLEGPLKWPTELQLRLWTPWTSCMPLLSPWRLVGQPAQTCQKSRNNYEKQTNKYRKIDGSTLSRLVVTAVLAQRWLGCFAAANGHACRSLTVLAWQLTRDILLRERHIGMLATFGASAAKSVRGLVRTQDWSHSRRWFAEAQHLCAFFSEDASMRHGRVGGYAM